MNEIRKRSTKNIIFGIIGQIIAIALGLIIPRLILVNFGSETNGLVNSVTQIFAYVSLFEAGVGGATLQALYKPVAKDDKVEISAILAATHKYYKKTGIIYVIGIVILSIVYPLLVKSDLPFFTIFWVIVFNGLGGAINFFFQGKYHILLEAEGKKYIKVNLTTLVHTLSSLLKVLILILGGDIVVVQAVYFVLNLAQMIYIVIYIKKHYKWLNFKEQPNYEAIEQKNSVMVHNVSSLIFGNTDSIILTIFTGLKVVSVYALIGALIGYVNTFLTIISSGIVFSIAQAYQISKDRFMKLYDMYEVVFYAMATFCIIMIFIFLNPFLKLYTSGVNDISYIDKYLPILFCIQYFLIWARVPVIHVIYNCAGDYRKTQKQSIIESIINIVVSIVGVYFLGIYGVLIGTIVALLFRTNEMIIYSSKKVLKRNAWITYRRLLINLIIIVVLSFLGLRLLPNISTYLELFGIAIIYAISILIILIVINYLLNKKVVKQLFFLVFNKNQ